MEFYRNLCRFCSKFVWRISLWRKKWQVWGLNENENIKKLARDQWPHTKENIHLLSASPPPRTQKTYTIWAKSPFFSPAYGIASLNLCLRFIPVRNVQNNLNDPIPQIRTISKIVSIFPPLGKIAWTMSFWNPGIAKIGSPRPSPRRQKRIFLTWHLITRAKFCQDFKSAWPLPNSVVK